MAMMVKNLIKEKRGMVSAIAAVVILYIVLECFGITCPIKFITGVSCARLWYVESMVSLSEIGF